MSKTENYASVWDAIADTPEQAANLRAQAELMRKISVIVKEQGWVQTEAAQRCGVTQPRMNDLLRGRASRFSLDALVNICTALGRRVRLILRPLDVGWLDLQQLDRNGFAMANEVLFPSEVSPANFPLGRTVKGRGGMRNLLDAVPAVMISAPARSSCGDCASTRPQPRIGNCLCLSR